MTSTVSILNKLIDLGHKKKKYPKSMDLMLHFINEAIIHQDPKLFVNNFIRYELLKTYGRRKRKLI
jgi:hypothetical protein